MAASVFQSSMTPVWFSLHRSFYSREDSSSASKVFSSLFPALTFKIWGNNALFTLSKNKIQLEWLPPECKTSQDYYGIYLHCVDIKVNGGWATHDQMEEVILFLESQMIEEAEAYLLSYFHFSGDFLTYFMKQYYGDAIKSGNFHWHDAQRIRNYFGGKHLLRHEGEAHDLYCAHFLQQKYEELKNVLSLQNIIDD